MLAAVLLASLWAQAEPAPAEPGYTAAIPQPDPGPPTNEPRPSLSNALSVQGRFAYRLGSEGSSLDPQAGFSVGGSYERRYLTLPPGLELGLMVDFFFDRFATSVVGSVMGEPGVEETFDGERSFSHTAFALLQTAGWRIGRMRPFIAGGVGGTFAFFATDELVLRPGSMNTFSALARGAVGVDVTLVGNTALIVRADYTHLFSQPTYTTATQTFSFWGDFIDVGAGLLVRF